MSEKKGNILKVLKVLEKTDKNNPINAKAISESIENEYGVKAPNRTTIYDDINFLVTMGYPIVKCNPEKYGWYMDSKGLQEWEIKILTDMISQSRSISQKEANDLKHKLLLFVNEDTKKRFASHMQPNSLNNQDESSIGDTLEVLIDAVYKKKKIEFQYTEILDDMTKVIKREGHIYSFNLYMLYWADGTYYLIGAHDKYEDLSCYRIDRMVNVRVSKDKMTPAIEKIGPNPELQIQEYIKQRVSHYSGKSIRVVIEYEPDAVSNGILYDFAGKDITVAKNKNGLCKATFTKEKSVTLLGWLMQYANRFKVIKPDSLRKELRQELETALKNYSD